MSKIRVVFASVNKWKKTIFTFEKIIIWYVNYRTLHVKRPGVASGVRPETKPLLRELNNYIKRTSPYFLRLASSDRPNFSALSKKKKKKKKEKETTKLNLFNFNRSPSIWWAPALTGAPTLINSFNFKDEHYNNITRHKRFGGVSFLLWNRPS